MCSSDLRPDILQRCKAAGYDCAVFGHNHTWENFYGDNTPGSGYPHHHTWDHDYRRFIPDGWQELKHQVRRPGFMPDEGVHGFAYAGCGPAHPLDEATVVQARHFLAAGRDRSRPFYLHVNIGAPHPGYGVEEPWFSRFDRERIRAFPNRLPEGATLPFTAQRAVRTPPGDLDRICREVQAVYYGMIAKVDEQIGAILGTLRDQGLDDSTVVLFWADHGDFAGQYGLPEKWDTVMADCLLHVPCILRGPDLPRGSVVDALTETVDLAPTLLARLGLPALADAHGADLEAEFAGRRRRPAVFAEGGHEEAMRARFAGMPYAARPDGKQRTYATCPDSMARCKMVRSERWKLVVRETGGDELYDLAADPWELRNLHGRSEHDGTVASLQRLLLAWCLRTDPDRPHQSDFGA